MDNTSVNEPQNNQITGNYDSSSDSQVETSDQEFELKTSDSIENTSYEYNAADPVQETYDSSSDSRTFDATRESDYPDSDS